MSEVTFTPEQIKEIRKRIEERASGVHQRNLLLAAFPLPKVTRYRTFTTAVAGIRYRLRDGVLEGDYGDGAGWRSAGFIGGNHIENVAMHMARIKDWPALAALADVCARPTEEVEP